MSAVKSQRSRRHSHVAGLVTAILAVALSLAILTNRQYIVDAMTVRQFTPSSAISMMVQRTDMTDKGRFYFYASRPQVQANQTFNSSCMRKEKNSAILGCYDGTNIYIYDVTDQRLDGIKAVTAAHEMLHAAYARLSDADKQRIDSLLESEYDKLKDNRNFTERMAFYARTEPGERSNELHSVIGTEVSDIGSELEQYYSRYFKDRQVVVQLHDGYSKVFTDLQDRANQLVKQLDTLSAAIKSDSAKYNTMVADLNKAISDFNARTQNNEFSSQSEFAQERAVLLQRADQLDQMRNDINASIARYDALQTQLESVSSQSDALNRSIDSSLAPAPTV